MSKLIKDILDFFKYLLYAFLIGLIFDCLILYVIDLGELLGGYFPEKGFFCCFYFPILYFVWYFLFLVVFNPLDILFKKLNIDFVELWVWTVSIVCVLVAIYFLIFKSF